MDCLQVQLQLWLANKLAKPPPPDRAFADTPGLSPLLHLALLSVLAGRGVPELRQFLLDRATQGEWTLEAGMATDRGEEEQVGGWGCVGLVGWVGGWVSWVEGPGLTCWRCHPAHPPPPPQALETVREQLFLRLYKELPYSVRLRLTSCLPQRDGSGAC